MNAVAGDIVAAASALAGRRMLYCVGAQRAGTSWLHKNVFARHPELHAPALKETHYWDRIRAPRGGLDRTVAGALKKATRELEWFRSASMLARAKRYHIRRPGRVAEIGRLLELRAELWREPDPRHGRYAAMLIEGSKAGQMLVDNTPAYALVDSGAFAEMAALGDARFIYILRDPVSRLWSGLRHRLGTKIESGALSGEDVVRRFAKAIDDPRSLDLARSDYKRTIEALERAVSRDSILYLFQETLFDQPICDSVADFLGIGRVKVRPERPVNKAIELRVEPDAALKARARERLAPVYDFVRERFGPAVPATWMK